MGIIEVRCHLEQAAPELKIIEFTQSTATVELAAAALKVEPDLIAKTMAFHLKEEDILIVMSGEAKINNRKFKDAFGQKAKMIRPERLVEITGHPMGGVCPFGLAGNLRVYLDSSLKKHPLVYPAAGAENAAVEVKLETLQAITRGLWITVSE